MAGQGGARVGAGKKKKSDELKIIQGNFRKHRATDTSSLSSKPAIAPSHLNDRAKYYFNLIVERLDGKASETFTEIIGLLAANLEEVEIFYTIIHETPFFTTVDSFGNTVIKAHPIAPLYKEAKRHSHTLLAECGLTWSSLGRTGGKGKEKETDPWDEL